MCLRACVVVDKGLQDGHGMCDLLAVLRAHAGRCLGMQVGLPARSPKLPLTPALPHVSPCPPCSAST